MYRVDWRWRGRRGGCFGPVHSLYFYEAMWCREDIPRGFRRCFENSNHVKLLRITRMAED
jgi:hypothetical protein